MTQVSFTASFHITETQNPLVVTPQSGAFDLSVGEDATGRPVAQVSGGVTPYSFALDPDSVMPDGLTFEEDGFGNITLSGTPTTAGDDTVVLLITDAAGAQVNLKSKVGVNRKKKIR